MKNKKITGAMIAMAAAGLVAVTPVMAANSSSNHGTGAQIQCFGTNACKGQGACKTSSNSCKGMNSCKGKGFVMVNSADECTNAGGKLSEQKENSAS